ncbi:MAG: SOS response-associated peptidase [Verrucomicrobia bacterium]|nr:SOS response-associated peptidase [Verrucomicrobiota bacterium]MCF7707322.1 SOS response-associated peptidase [Verrucomicrobiota bacterium]
MCARYTLHQSGRAVTERFKLNTAANNLKPRYNIAPSQLAPVITNNGARGIQFFKWGFIPSWAKDATQTKPLINARAETINSKASFKSAFRHRRCIIPADGFYEWKKEGNAKTPCYFTVDGGALFGFAGLWEEHNDPTTGLLLQTFALITVTPNEIMAPIHNRMPAILDQASEDTWLSGNIITPEELSNILAPFPSSRLSYSRVSRFMNSPRNDSPKCIEPADEGENNLPLDI